MKSEELAAVIREIKERVRSRHRSGVFGVGNIPIPDLMPLLHARDAAAAKVAAIGTVNPRAGGFANAFIQRVKKLVARALDWHVREQVEFNRASVSALQSILDAFEENNRALSQLAGYFDGEISKVHGEISKVRGEIAELRQETLQRMLAEAQRTEALLAEARELKDVRRHWAEWRAGWEERWNRSEVHMLRTISELNASFQHRSTLTENEFRTAMREQHENYRLSLQQAGREIQERLWQDLERVRREYEQMIHAELRVMRQRTVAQQAAAPPPEPSSAVPGPAVDWLHFSDRFRGSEDRIRAAQSLYLDRFAGLTDLLDIGCGRGEFLEAAAAAGISARGIDLNPECVALCRSKGLAAETADLFEYLAQLPGRSLGGVYCSQVIEHLPPARLPELVQLAAAKVRTGGRVAFETPNPECLAIFATHFYLDPTHTRPVPAPLMAFYLEEAGFGRIEVVRLSPAADSIPALCDISEPLRTALFGSLDYAIFGTKLGSR
jgi:2-polyprenyl-3-methyl-5-hydroxy-6-metoxy-1,4-benzoquinol methylase